LAITPEPAIRNPTLGLPKLERDEIGKCIKLTIEGLKDYLRFFILPAEILHLVFKNIQQYWRKNKLYFCQN